MRYAEGCGLTLARAHARSGDAAMISGYLGKADMFDQVVGDFRDGVRQSEISGAYTKLEAAVKTGRIKALVEEDL